MKFSSGNVSKLINGKHGGKTNLENASSGRKKTIKGILIGTILGTLITGGIGVGAVTLTADQVKYSSSDSEFAATNVKTAIDELYKISLENSETQNVVDLGNGTSFDLTSYQEYKNFTADNFLIVASSSVSNSKGSVYAPGYSNVAEGRVTASYSTTKSYDAETGILTAYATLAGFYSRAGGTTTGGFPSFSTKLEVNVYLIY